MEKLLKHIIFVRSCCYLYAEMADFVSLHNNTRQFFPSYPLHSSIAQMILNITISIYNQKSKATDWYWWRFGPAKFDDEMANFVDNDVMYHYANRDGDTMME